MKRLAIHSVPRSGSTWLGALVDSHPNIVYKYQPLFSYAFKGALNEKSSTNEIKTFFDEIADFKDDFLDQSLERKRGISPIFDKGETLAIVYKEVRYHHIVSNLLKNDDSIKVVGLVRDPRAVLYSWWNAPKEFKKDEGWNFEEEWYAAPSKNLNKIEEFYGYKKWKETASNFLQLANQYPSRFRLLRYIDLLTNTETEVKKLMRFFDLELHNQQVQFIQNSKGKHSFDAYSVFKQKQQDDSWYGHLPEYVSDHIERDLKGTDLEVFL